MSSNSTSFDVATEPWSCKPEQIKTASLKQYGVTLTENETTGGQRPKKSFRKYFKKKGGV